MNVFRDRQPARFERLIPSLERVAVDYSPFGGIRNAVTGLDLTVDGTLTPEPNAAGVGLRSTGAATNFLTGPATGNTSFCVVAVVVPGSVTGNNHIADADATSGSRDFQLRLNGTSAEFIRFNTAPSAFTVTVSGVASIGRPLVMVAWSDGTDFGLECTGGRATGTITGTPRTWNEAPTWFSRPLAHSGSPTGANLGIVLRAVFSSALTSDLRRAIALNPWRTMLRQRRVWVPVGAGLHEATGALASDAAAIAGTATHLTLHATSGALASDAATIAGAATHLTLHTTSGALASDAAVIAGTADHATGGEHPTEGALSSDAAAIAGAAAHLTLHTTTGALAADAATVAGSAAHLTLHTTSGALSSDPATMAGVAVHSGAGATAPMTGAGRPSRSRRPRVVEIDGEDFIVNSEEEAAALLDQARETAKERAATAIKRAAAAERRPVRKVLADARRLLEVPDIAASDDLMQLAQQAQADIESIYTSALASVEIAALLARRQREEEDDEDVLLLIA